MESSWAHFSGDVPLSWPQPVSLFPQLCARLCLGGNLKYEMEIHWSWQLQRGERGWSLACLFGVQATPLISGSGCPKRQEGKERENCSERSGRRRHGMGSRKARIQRCAFPCKGRRVGGGAPRECWVGENSLHPELQRTALPRPQRTLAQALFWVGQ